MADSNLLSIPPTDGLPRSPRSAGTYAGDVCLMSVTGCHRQGEVIDSTISHKMSYNRVIESEKNPVVVKLSDGMPVYVFALAHCGVMGTLNRNRGSGDKLLLDRQKNDWARVRIRFMHHRRTSKD